MLAACCCAWSWEHARPSRCMCCPNLPSVINRTPTAALCARPLGASCQQVRSSTFMISFCAMPRCLATYTDEHGMHADIHRNVSSTEMYASNPAMISFLSGCRSVSHPDPVSMGVLHCLSGDYRRLLQPPYSPRRWYERPPWPLFGALAQYEWHLILLLDAGPAQYVLS